MLSTGPGTSRCLGATSWPTERVKQTAQPVRLRVRNLLLETAFLNTTELGWVLLSDSIPRLCFIITDSSLASSFYKAHPGAPAPPLITAAAGLKTTSEDDRLLGPALRGSLLPQGAMLYCVCPCVTRRTLKQWQVISKVGYKDRCFLSLTRHSQEAASCFSLSWGAQGKAYG